MDKSEIKGMIREVVKEIYQRSPPKTTEELFSMLGIKEKPEFTQVEAGRRLGISSVRNLLKLSEVIIQSSIKADVKTYKRSVELFDISRDNMISFLLMWAQRIYEQNPKIKDEMDKHILDARDHMGQIAAQGSRVVDSSTEDNQFGKVNYINALKEFRHLKEIVANAEKSVDEFFNLAKRVGLK